MELPSLSHPYSSMQDVQLTQDFQLLFLTVIYFSGHFSRNIKTIVPLTFISI